MSALKPAFSVAPWPRNRGGPHVMARRFIHAARRRRFAVLPEWLVARGQPCLLNIGGPGQDRILQSGRHVAYRVAGMFIRELFERLGSHYHDRTFREEFERANEKIRQALRQASFVIYQSQWSKKHLDTLHARAGGTWRVIPNAVDLEAFRPPADWPRPAGEVPVLGAVGAMRYRPRLEALFDVAGRLDVRPRLLLIGDLDEHCRRAMARAMEDPAWAPMIEHVPSVPPGRLAEYYRRMDCLVHTVSGDSCPNVVVEALACGVPVVCPLEGGTAELVGPAGVAADDPGGVLGEEFRCGMARGIKSVLGDLGEYQKAARRRARDNHDLEVLTSAYLDAMGLPPYACQRNVKYAAARALGRLGAWVTPRAREPGGRRPRIGVVLWDWNLGGIASWMFHLARALAEYEFHFIATYSARHAPQCEQLGKFAYAASFWALRRYLRQQGISLVQINNNRWPADAARSAGVPRVVERIAGTRSCCTVPKDDLDCVILSAQGYLKYVRQFWPEARCEVIHNAVDLHEVDNAPAPRRADDAPVVFGCCTRFGRGKRLDLLIEATRLLVERGLRVRLVLAGEDSALSNAEPVKGELVELAGGLEGIVEFPGRTEEPLSLTKGFDVGVSASNDEGIPNSLIEPMACGKPVVATDVGQVRELVQDSVNGFLVPPRDVESLARALEKLAVDARLRERLGRRARQTIQRDFSFEVAVDKYRRVYGELLEHA